jgi:hypothetical protein
MSKAPIGVGEFRVNKQYFHVEPDYASRGTRAIVLADNDETITKRRRSDKQLAAGREIGFMDTAAQLSVFFESFILLPSFQQYGNVRICIFPQLEKLFVVLPAFDRVAREWSGRG